MVSRKYYCLVYHDCYFFTTDGEFIYDLKTWHMYDMFKKNERGEKMIYVSC